WASGDWREPSTSRGTSPTSTTPSAGWGCRWTRLRRCPPRSAPSWRSRRESEAAPGAEHGGRSMTAPGTTLTSVEVQGLAVFRRGKVRDTFELDDRTLLMVATDRISAFDVVLPTPIPDKGAVLTQMSRWWFARTADVVPNHLRDDDPASLPAAVDWNALGLRSMRVARGERVDIECVV